MRACAKILHVITGRNREILYDHCASVSVDIFTRQFVLPRGKEIKTRFVTGE